MRFATLLVVAAPALARAQLDVSGTIVTANMTANTASVVDIATGATRATYPTPAAPHEVAISNDGRTAAISVYGDRSATGHSLLLLDLTGEKPPRTIEMGTYVRPHGMRFLPGDAKLVVTSEATQRVVIVDVASGKIDTTIATGGTGTHMIVVPPPATRAFTTNVGSGNISMLDLQRDTLVKLIDAGTRIEGVAISPDGNELWVGANDAKVVIVFDARTGAEITRIEGFGFPYRMAITPNGNTGVVTDPGAERVMLVDAKTHRIRSTIEMANLEGLPASAAEHPSPQGVILSRDDKAAFVTLKGAGMVAVIDLSSTKVVRLLTVGGGSDGVGFSPVVRR